MRAVAKAGLEAALLRALRPRTQVFSLLPGGRTLVVRCKVTLNTGEAATYTHYYVNRNPPPQQRHEA